jgi:hypothetical protein
MPESSSNTGQRRPTHTTISTHFTHEQTIPKPPSTQTNTTRRAPSRVPINPHALKVTQHAGTRQTTPKQTCYICTPWLRLNFAAQLPAQPRHTTPHHATRSRMQRKQAQPNSKQSSSSAGAGNFQGQIEPPWSNPRPFGGPLRTVHCSGRKWPTKSDCQTNQGSPTVPVPVDD